jgi:hypothetical protein
MKLKDVKQNVGISLALKSEMSGDVLNIKGIRK